jgi:type IV pilus assembly protein PilE
MVVVAVLAILATIAIPAYERLMQSVRRGDGRAAAHAIALAQERFFTLNGRYYTGVTPASLFGTTLADSALKCESCSWPACGWSNCTSAKGHYTLAVTAGTVTVTRTPSAADPYCTAMTISLRNGVQGGSGSDPAKCWR